MVKIRHHKYLFFIGGLFCIILAGFLLYNIFQQIKNGSFPRPRQTNVELIQEWMTLPYIARTYRVPEPVLREKLAIDFRIDRRASIDDIAKEQQKDTQTFIQEVRIVIKEFQATHPVPSVTQ